MPTLKNLYQSQQLDWGSIRWLVEPGRGGSESVSAGFLTFNARSVQEGHVHIGYEQILYIVSGQGRHVVNGEETPLAPGSLVHIPPFAKHAMYNDSDEPLTIISLYFPLRSQQMPEIQEKPDEEEFESGVIWSFLDMHSLEVLLEKLSQALNFRLTLVDVQGNVILSSSNRTPFCLMLREASNARHCRKRLREVIREHFPSGEGERKDTRGILFKCCNSIASILIPVYGNKKMVGFIKCGEAFFSKSDQCTMTAPLQKVAERYGLSPSGLLQAASGVRVEMKSVLYAASEATLAVANYITEMASAAMRRRKLDKSKLSLAEEQMASAKLEKALREADFKLLQSQINPHFLFNTLNTVSQMAYIEGNHKVAQTLWSLSDLLRFTLRRSEELIALQEELKLLRDYVLIQQTRYGSRLTVTWDIEPGIDAALVPCMLLQPLVENAIIHGLEPLVGPGHITITTRKESTSLYICIKDNGAGFSPHTIIEKTGHIGIASVRNRLQYYFADASTFSLESAPGMGTKVSIRMPFITTVEECRAGTPQENPE